MIRKSILFNFLLLLFIPICLKAQPDSLLQGEVQVRSILSNGESLPFWMWANQSGMIKENGKAHQLAIASLHGTFITSLNGAKIFYGLNTSGELTRNNHLQLNELYAGIQYQILILSVGSSARAVQAAGLSSTNTDLDYSNNARPYPKLALSTNGFLPVAKGFAINACFEEALLNDPQEVIDHLHLHHKNLSLRFGNPSQLTVTAGLDHYVFWGGTSPTMGKLPSGVSDYLRYIFSRKGASDFLETDRINAAGNTLGQYKIEVNKPFEAFDLQLYVCHPFEDRSGRELSNYRDNLIGVWIKCKDPKALVRNVVAEYYYMLNQSGAPLSTDGAGQKTGTFSGGDNYFNNGVYSSGYTYYGMMMGSPLFYPVVYDGNGKAAGIANNRFLAFHLGAEGCLAERLEYQLMGTFSRNWGTYGNPYPGHQNRFNSLVQLAWQPAKCPVQLTGAVAFDHAQQLENTKVNSKSILGFSLGLLRKF